MTPERWQQVDQLLEMALDHATHERAALLQQACANDADLRQEVEALLQAHDCADGFLEAPPASAMAQLLHHVEQEDLSGRLIGPYRLARQVGGGGMGVVYLATRDDDAYQKQVAIKLLWAGPQNDELLRRFRRERQILANLEHPHIARLLDGGRTAEGWPYLVMEYVAGLPITAYCRERQLTITERLQLFQKICAAVQYAHQNLVIHRDLKPSNILVTEDVAEPVPKLLDFGIAKLLEPAQPSAPAAITAERIVTAQPATIALLMTPAYASPEQVRGEVITTASDVYSLGVLLYELLTGNSPYHFKDRSLPALMQAVCEQEPWLPSEKVQQAQMAVADFGEAKREKLSARLRGDLDQIALTALHKDAQLRYRTVEQLSEDLRRHLEGKPILARGGAWLYRAKKFVRRYKAGVALVALLALTLLGGIITTTWQARVAREQARINRRLAYAGQMALATQAWEMANLARLRELVENYLPGDGQEDLRGFEWYYLWRLYHHTGERFSRQHSEQVWAVAFAPDGQRFATGCDDGKARLWDAATGALLAELSGHQQYIWSVAFAPDGRTLATGSGDGTAKLWDAATGRELATFQGHTKRVSHVQFSADGKRLATGSRDGTAKMWDVTTARELLTIPTGAGYVESIALSPDGRKLAIGRNLDPALKLYDTTAGRAIGVDFEYQSAVWSVAFSPDGKTIAAGQYADIKLWEAATGRARAVFTGHTGEVRAVAFSPDGQKLATASGDRTVKLWNVTTRQELATLKGHLSENFAVAFAPDGKSLVTGSADRTARLWDVATASELNTLYGVGGKLAFVALAPDAQRLATSSSNKPSLPTLWDATTLQKLVGLGKAISCTSLAFSPDGKKLVTGNIDKTARLWDAATGQDLLTFSGHTNEVKIVAISPDGRLLATGSADKTVKLWDVATGREMSTLRGHSQQIGTLAFAPDGRRLASGSYDQTAKLWEVATGQELATIAGHANPILTLAFAPDGQTLATGSADSLVKLWRADTGTLLNTIKGHAGHVRALAFAPDGKRLATGGSEGLVRLWDVATGQELIALRGHTDVVNTVAFSADGRTLISSAADDSVRVWRAASEQEVQARRR